MNTTNNTFLYGFLPAIYRQQDQQLGLPLQTLLSIMEAEWQNIKAQIDTAYNNCFVETCESWVETLYIGDLLGIQGLHNSNIIATQRARIANTIRYRRRKGQRGVLENIINSVTGWQVMVVEYAQLLGMTQYLQHIRLGKGQTVNIRDIYGIDTLGTPFEVNAHRVDVRNIPRYPTKFNINNLGLFIWRLVSYPITEGTAYAVDTTSNQKYTFHPVGFDTQLFNTNQVLTESNQTATETNLPVAVRPAAFQEDLAEYNPQNDPQNSEYYGPQKGFSILLNNNLVTPSQIVAADLSQWVAPAFSATQEAAIDVQLGRILLKNSNENVIVNYNYGFSAPIGGGHYDRRQTLSVVDVNTVYVPVAPPELENSIVKSTLKDAIDYWQNNPITTVIQIQDDSTYILSAPMEINNTLSQPRSLTIQAANNSRPCLRVLDNNGNINPITIVSANDNTLQVTLNGLLIDSSLDLQKNVSLTISHCTVIPRDHVNSTAKVSLFCSSSEGPSNVVVGHSIMGAIYLPGDTASLTISDSIIDAQQQVALAAVDSTNNSSPVVMPIPATLPGPNTTLEQVTIFGSVYVSELILLSNSIITQNVKTDRTQTGAIRFSYLPFDSETPPRYQCQPDLDFIPLAKKQAKAEGLSETNYTQLKTQDPTWWNNTLLTLEPQFTAVQYNEPGYAQLNINSNQSVLMGADNGAEMGCFQSLNQPQLQQQLQAILDEYVPFGLITGLFYVDVNTQASIIANSLFTAPPIAVGYTINEATSAQIFNYNPTLFNSISYDVTVADAGTGGNPSAITLEIPNNTGSLTDATLSSISPISSNAVPANETSHDYIITITANSIVNSINNNGTPLPAVTSTFKLTVKA